MKLKKLLRTVMLMILICNFSAYSFSQIYAPEGLNMPGSWNDNWVNPPTNPAFASSTQVSGGQIFNIELGTQHYQTIFDVSSSGDISSGDYEFLFTSGPEGSYWQNKWANIDVQLNTIQTYTLNGTENNSISLNDSKWYTMNWENIGYSDTRAIFMETSGEPVQITNVLQSPILPQENETVTITIEINDTKSPEEYVYLRYTTDGWTSSTLVAFNFTGTSGTAQIPGQVLDTEVEYYIFTTIFDAPTEDIDLLTINYNNNFGNNFSYISGQQITCGSDVALISTQPPFPLADQSVIITFNAMLGNAGLAGYEDDVYAHIGVITSESTSNTDWKYVLTEWGENTPETKFTNIGEDLYELSISNIREYFGVPADEDILYIAMVVRSQDPIDPEEPDNFYVARNADGTDILIEVYDLDLNVKILSPSRKDALAGQNDVLPVCVEALQSSSIDIYIDNEFITTESGTSITYGLTTSTFSTGLHWLYAYATNGTETVKDSVPLYVRGQINIADLPEGISRGGIYYNESDDTEATLVLHDPAGHKNFAFILGDFNNWTVTDEGYMNKTVDGKFYWKTITGLTPGEEYAYQYFIDGELKIADPYAEKILDPWNDQWITEYNYPNLIEYPTNKTLGSVSVLQTAQEEYNWQYSDNFIPAAQGSTHKNLIIYELHIRDFVETQAIKDVQDKLDYLEDLGVNTIELMPINEFEGNDSWGYNPSFYFAPDKAYGTPEDYKNFIDECHHRGIAVVIDMVLNHSFRMSPFVLMYYDEELDQPTWDNPWYNQVCPNPDYNWGYDFNHESDVTKQLVKDVCSFWLTEYKIDGFRFDFTKGFTNTPGDGNSYDLNRINVLKEYNSHIYDVYNNGGTRYPYVILEHLTEASEEAELAANGLMLWTGSTLNGTYNQATMGWESNSDFSYAYYGNRGWTNANLVQYMESHDEERMMYKNLLYGNYDHTLEEAIKHTQTVVPMFLLIPGPKMIWQFQELGYDISIDEPCRVCPKPIHWEYLQDPIRKELYNTFSATTKLIEYSHIFEGDNTSFTSDLGLNVKRMWLSNGNINMVVAGNISGTETYNITPGFQENGTWYDYFTGENFEVTDNAGHTVELSPGEIHIWTNEPIAVELTFELTNETTGNPVSNASITLSTNETINSDNLGFASSMVQLNQSINYEITRTGYASKSGTINIGTDNVLEQVELTPTVSIEEEAEQFVNIYPNPNSGNFTISTSDKYEISIYNLSGKLILKDKILKGTKTIDLSQYGTGIYLIQFRDNTNIFYKKVIINE